MLDVLPNYLFQTSSEMAPGAGGRLDPRCDERRLVVTQI